MYTRHGPIASYEIRLPEICAWCGQRTGTSLRSVHLRDGVSLSHLRHTMVLPICSECEAYVKAYYTAQLRMIIRFTTVSLPLTLGLTYVLLQPLNHLFVWLSWLVLASGGAWLIAKWVLTRPWGQRRVEQMVTSLTGPPPPGYTAWGSDPAQLMGQGRLCFANGDFPRAFAPLNPDLSLCIGGGAVSA